MLSGKKPVSVEDFGPELNIVHWVNTSSSTGPFESFHYYSLKHYMNNIKNNNIPKPPVFDFLVHQQARSLIRKGDVCGIIDPCIAGNVKIESIWRVAEVANQCVEQRGHSRPRMQEVIMAIQDAIRIERGNENGMKSSSSSSSKAQSSRKTLLTSFLEIESPDISRNSLAPAAR